MTPWPEGSLPQFGMVVQRKDGPEEVWVLIQPKPDGDDGAWIALRIDDRTVMESPWYALWLLSGDFDLIEECRT